MSTFRANSDPSESDICSTGLKQSIFFDDVFVHVVGKCSSNMRRDRSRQRVAKWRENSIKCRPSRVVVGTKVNRGLAGLSTCA